MILVRTRMFPSGDELVSPEGDYILRTHAASNACWENGCVIHNPSKNAMSDFPLNWREDRGIMERICPHGVGHPDFDSAAYFDRNGMSHMNVHGCCSYGCCAEIGDTE